MDSGGFRDGFVAFREALDGRASCNDAGWSLGYFVETFDD